MNNREEIMRRAALFMSRAEEVRLIDLRNFDPKRSNNGGAYSFTVYFTRTGENEFTATFDTSADFPYCPIHGRFMECSECWQYQDPCEDCKGCLAGGDCNLTLGIGGCEAEYKTYTVDEVYFHLQKARREHGIRIEIDG
mgnify:CR=1 FL=1